jgi:hypothetical protein
MVNLEVRIVRNAESLARVESAELFDSPCLMRSATNQALDAAPIRAIRMETFEALR